MPGPSQITRITSARASGSAHSPTAAGTSGGPTSVTAAVVVGPSLANAASDCPMAARVEAAPVVLAVPDVEAAVDEPASGAAISDADGVASPEPSAVDAPEGRPSGLAGTVVRRSDGVDGDTSSDGVVACGSCRANGERRRTRRGSARGQSRQRGGERRRNGDPGERDRSGRRSGGRGEGDHLSLIHI